MTKKKIKPATNIFDFSDFESIDVEWQGMPEYNQPDNGAFRQIVVEFDNDSDVKEFGKLIQQNTSNKTKSLWFPPRERNDVVDLFWVSTIEE